MLLAFALPSQWNWGMVSTWKSGCNGSQPCRGFHNSLSNIPAHNICIGFPPCPPYHHLIPHQTTNTNATATASIFLKPPSQRETESRDEHSRLSFFLEFDTHFLSFLQITCLSSHLSLFSRLVLMVEHRPMCSSVTAGPRL